MSSFYYQGSYTTGPSEFQHFSRTVKDHIYKNPRPVIARKTEKTQTNQQTMKHFCYVSARVCSFWSISLSILEASSSFRFEQLRRRFDCATYWPVFDCFSTVSLREADELGVSALASRTEGLECKPQDIKGPGLSELDEDTAFEDINWIIGTDRSAINAANSLCLLPLLLLLQGCQPSHVFKYWELIAKGW